MTGRTGDPDQPGQSFRWPSDRLWQTVFPVENDCGYCGIAKVAEGQAKSMTQTNAVLGSPEYMSPEQCKGGGALIDAKSDIYSFGVILFRLLSGRLPFTADGIGALIGIKIGGGFSDGGYPESGIPEGFRTDSRVGSGLRLFMRSSAPRLTTSASVSRSSALMSCAAFSVGV